MGQYRSRYVLYLADMSRYEDETSSKAKVKVSAKIKAKDMAKAKVKAKVKLKDQAHFKVERKV